MEQNESTSQAGVLDERRRRRVVRKSAGTLNDGVGLTVVGHHHPGGPDDGVLQKLDALEWGDRLS